MSHSVNFEILAAVTPKFFAASLAISLLASINVIFQLSFGNIFISSQPAKSIRQAAISVDVELAQS